MELGLVAVLVLGLAVLVGAIVQSSVGFGVGLVGAPVVTIVDPTLMPASLLVVGGALPLLMLHREWRHVDRRGLGWALVGRTPGAALGALVVAWLPTRQIGVAVGVSVLVAVALSWSSLRLTKSRLSLLGAGAVSGVTGTAAAIGGPPLGLVYAHDPGPVVRSTLAAYFLVGSVLSLGMLAVAGEVSTRSLVAGALALPFLAAGTALARPLARSLDAGYLGNAILIVAALSGAVLLVRSLV